MTNCFWNSLLAALRPEDFIHFPFAPGEDPKTLFAPYFKSQDAFAGFLEKLASIQHTMYAWDIPNEEDPKKKLPRVLSHVLVDGDLASPRVVGDWVKNIRSKEFDVRNTIRQGFYSTSAGDGLLILICEFTGIRIETKLPAYTATYERLNTPCRSTIRLRCTGNKDNGHVSFQGRVNNAMVREVTGKRKLDEIK